MFLRLFDSDIESSLHESDFQSDPDEISSHINDSDTIYDPEVDIVDNTAKFDENWRFLCVADVEADPVYRRLDKLIRNIVRRRVGFGNRQSSSKEIRMNLGGPGTEIFR